MAKSRIIDTRFWNDNFIVELDPLGRYLYLYLLTNSHTNISGIYEIPLRTISFETGLKMEKISELFKIFDGRIHYIKGWICLKNFLKYQATSSGTVIKGVETNLQKIPNEIIDKLIGYEYPIHRSSDHSIYLNLNFNSNFNLNSNSNLTKKEEKKLGESFEKFWTTYPKKYAKKKAYEIWKKISPSEELTETIVSAVVKARKTAGWLQDGGKYIPHPTTYLNQERWMDQVEERKIKSVNLK
jgi:hypothetical protein|tara:strand:+ start:1964 stop:2686 length:723 start_codon:yes stop_codon:yes gene_type:complete